MTFDLATLKHRAQLYSKIRQFFSSRNILEVETPSLARSSNPAPHLLSLHCEVELPGKHKQRYYLQTSPEFHMKRLLAQGAGSIYQICKAFRDGEIGKHHNPEFTLLEWYRPGLTHLDLMQEVDDFLQYACDFPQALQLSYAQAFQECLQLDPHQASTTDLYDCLHLNNIIVSKDCDKTSLLELCVDQLILPKLSQTQPIFIYDFPAEQAQLARVRHEQPPIAERFELFYQGIELGNAFHELTDSAEQTNRFQADLTLREQLGLESLPLDQAFLTALDNMPACAGIAIGIDRLLLCMERSTHLKLPICFDILSA